MNLLKVYRKEPFSTKNKLESYDFYDKLARKLTSIFSPDKLRKTTV